MNSALNHTPRPYSSTIAPLEVAVLAIFEGRIVEIVSSGAEASRIRDVADGEVATVRSEALRLCQAPVKPEGPPAPEPQAYSAQSARISPHTDTEDPQSAVE